MSDAVIASAGETGQPVEPSDLEKELGARGVVKSLDPTMRGNAEKPAAVAKPEGDQPPPEPKDKAEDKVEDDDQPSNKAFAGMRKALKDAQTQIEELRQSRAATPEPKTVTEAPAITADKAFEQLNAALAGKGDDPATATQQAKEAIEKLSVGDIRKIVARAERGEFGDNSANILALAKDELSPAVARHMEAQEVQQQEQAKSAAWQKENSTSLAAMLEKNPDLANTESDLFKFLGKFREEHIAKLDNDGNVTQPGPLYALMSDPKWPEKVIPIAVAMFKAQAVEAKAGEADALKKKLEKARTPMGGDGHAATPGAVSESDDLLNQIAGRGKIRG